MCARFLLCERYGMCQVSGRLNNQGRRIRGPAGVRVFAGLLCTRRRGQLCTLLGGPQEDGGWFFRTSPSDARQGQVLADIAISRGQTDMAVTYTNNDYGKGLADAFASAYEAVGGTITVMSGHEDDKADYSADVAALSAGGSTTLAVQIGRAHV